MLLYFAGLLLNHFYQCLPFFLFLFTHPPTNVNQLLGTDMDVSRIFILDLFGTLSHFHRFSVVYLFLQHQYDLFDWLMKSRDLTEVANMAYYHPNLIIINPNTVTHHRAGGFGFL